MRRSNHAEYEHVCTRCQEPIAIGTKVCDCGKPTPYMSFAERTEHEVAQWRAHQARSAG